MTLKELKKKVRAKEINFIRFISMACNPIMIEVNHNADKKTLLRNHHGDIYLAHNIAMAYEVCRKANIHQADLVQIIAHDEACADTLMRPTSQTMSLKF